MTETILDNTMLTAFNTCPTKFYWRHVRHLVGQGENHAALDFGSAIHSALATLYNGGSKTECIDSFAKAMEGAATDDKRNLQNGLAILAGYFEKWLPEQFKIKQVEIALQWELSSDLIYCGKVDGLVEWMGDVYILEHKTSSSMSQFVAQPNHQISGYIYGSQVLGQSTVGAIVNLVAVLKTKQDYHRILTYRAKWELDDWRLHVLHTKRRIDEAIETGFFDRHTHSCTYCPYKDLCTSPPDAVEAVITSKYKESPWEPWKQEIAT